MPLKIGDQVEVIELIAADSYHGVRIGDKFIITNCRADGDYLHGHPKKDGRGCGYLLKEQVKLVRAKPGIKVTKTSMNCKQFRADIEETFKKALLIIDQKNHDYSGTIDPFSSFRNAQIAGVGVTQSLVLAVVQKVSRMGNLIQRPAKVVSESLEDTIVDCINYLAILLAWLHSKQNDTNSKS